jgi:ketosteroid isomerase-like protein
MRQPPLLSVDLRHFMRRRESAAYIAQSGAASTMTSPGLSRFASTAREGSSMLKTSSGMLIGACLATIPAPAPAAPRETSEAIASTIKADVAQIVAGINAKDIGKAVEFDAPDLVSMESGREPSLGAKADRDGLTMAFKYAPNWHLSLIDETVDVARSGDMAVYRGTYAEDSLHDGVPFTHKGNYVAGFRRDADGVWRVHWSVIAWQSASKTKG